MSPPIIVFSTSWFGVRILPEGKKKRWQTKHVHWEVGQLVWGAPEFRSYSLKYRVATKVHNEKTTSTGWVSESQSEPGWFTGQFFARKLVFISYCKNCQLKLWCGIRARVAALLLCVNCQLLQHRSFCLFGLSFIIQQQCWQIYAPWSSYDGSKKLGFACWCFVLFLNLSKSLCCAIDKWDGRSNHCTLLMFDPPFHNLSHGKHNTHVSNPLSNNRTWVKFHQTFWKIVHVPKWKRINPRNFQAWTWEELPIHPQVSYKTKLRYETFEMPCWENSPL